jgi:hypothetical protein
VSGQRKVYRVGTGLDLIVSGPGSKRQAREAAVLGLSERLAEPITLRLEDGREVTIRLWTRDDPDGRPLPPLAGVHDYSAYLLITEEEATHAG